MSKKHKLSKEAQEKWDWIAPFCKRFWETLAASENPVLEIPCLLAESLEEQGEALSVYVLIRLAKSRPKNMEHIDLYENWLYPIHEIMRARALSPTHKSDLP